MRLHLNPINARRNQSTRAAKEVGGSDRLCVRSLLRSYRGINIPFLHLYLLMVHSAQSKIGKKLFLLNKGGYRDGKL